MSEQKSRWIGNLVTSQYDERKPVDGLIVGLPAEAEGKYIVTESERCLTRLSPYLKGRGLDMGAGACGVTPEAICIDQAGSAQFRCDFEKQAVPDELRVAEGYPWIFSAHCLEHLTQERRLPVLREWWELVRPDGFLILYLPDDELYGKDHGLNFISTLSQLIAEFPEAEVSHAGRYGVGDCPEYSFEIVLRKKA